MTLAAIPPPAPSASLPLSPKVSVSMVTYNHEKFIAQAVESVLKQKTAFPYELVIGEDCSSDRTRAIVSDFQRAHSSIIRLRLAEQNLGGMANFVQTLGTCRGQYIALLDGDDYWTSDLKLQRQANVLDEQSVLAMCYHDVLTFEEDGGVEARTISARRRQISSLDDLLLASPPSCSVMFRRGLFEEFPSWFHTLEIGDWPLHILNAQRGRVGYIDEVMAAHRKHSGGVYSSLTRGARLEARIEVYRCLESYLEARYRRTIRSMISKCYYGMALECEKAGEATRARAYARKSVALRPLNRYLSMRRVAGTLLRLHSPLAYRLARGTARILRSIRPTTTD